MSTRTLYVKTYTSAPPCAARVLQSAMADGIKEFLALLLLQLVTEGISVLVGAEAH